MKPLAVCVIGNSHLAAISLAEDRLAERYPDIELDFFGAAARHLAGLAIEGSALVPRNTRLARALALTSGGKQRIETAGYDAFILVGLRFGITSLASLVASRRPFELATETADLVSWPFLRAASRSLLCDSLALAIARRIRQAREAIAPPAPILLIPAPFPSESARGRENAVWSFDDSLRLLRQIYDEACSSLTAEAPCELLPQPPQTVVEPAFTRQVYSVGSTRLEADAEHPDDDFRHMNADYGAIVLEAAFQRLEALVGPRARSRG